MLRNLRFEAYLTLVIVIIVVIVVMVVRVVRVVRMVMVVRGVGMVMVFLGGWGCLGGQLVGKAEYT